MNIFSWGPASYFKAFEFSLNVPKNIVFKNIIRTCLLLCKRLRCNHSINKTQVEERIFKLSQIHVSVIYQISWISWIHWISYPFRRSFIKTENSREQTLAYIHPAPSNASLYYGQFKEETSIEIHDWDFRTISNTYAYLPPKIWPKKIIFWFFKIKETQRNNKPVGSSGEAVPRSKFYFLWSICNTFPIKRITNYSFPR